MFWKVIEKGGYTNFIGTAEVEPPDVAYSEAWGRFTREIMPLNAGVEWDFLKIEFWLDAGETVIYPASSVSRWRVEKAVCQVIITSVRKDYDQMVCANLPGHEITTLVGGWERTLADQLVKTSKEYQLPKRLGRSSLQLSFWTAEASAPTMEIVI